MRKFIEMQEEKIEVKIENLITVAKFEGDRIKKRDCISYLFFDPLANKEIEIMVRYPNTYIRDTVWEKYWPVLSKLVFRGEGNE